MKRLKGFKSKVVTPFVDLILGRTMSKKLTVFLIGTIGWFKGMLTGAEWLILSGIYLFGLLYLNHMENMSKFRKHVNNDVVDEERKDNYDSVD